MSHIQVQQASVPSSSFSQIDLGLFGSEDRKKSISYQVGTQRIMEGGQPEAVVSRPLANRVQHLSNEPTGYNAWPFDQEIDADLKNQIRKAAGKLPYDRDREEAFMEIRRILRDINPCAERNWNMILACLQALDGSIEYERKVLFKNERFWLKHVQTGVASRWCATQVKEREEVMSAVCSVYPSMKSQARIYLCIDDRIRQLVGDANFKMSKLLLEEMTQIIRSGKIEEDDVWQGPLKEKILEEFKQQSNLQLKPIGKPPRKRPRLEQQNTKAAATELALPPSVTRNCVASPIPADPSLDSFYDLLNKDDLRDLLNDDFLKNALGLLPKEASEAIGAGETLEGADESSLVAQASSRPAVQAQQTCDDITIEDIGSWLADEQMSQNQR